MGCLPHEVKKAKRIAVLCDKGVMRLEEERNKGIVEQITKVSKQARGGAGRWQHLIWMRFQQRALEMESENDLKQHTRNTLWNCDYMKSS